MPTRVLVTGCGGGTGLEVTRFLSEDSRYEVIAGDMDNEAAGLYLPNIKQQILPPANDRGYVSQIMDICTNRSIQALVPGTEEEHLALARSQHLLEETGVKSWLADPATIERCMDKWAFHLRLSEAGVPVPATALSVTELPSSVERVVVKPRNGRGSRGVHYYPSLLEAESRFTGRAGDFLIQEQLDGPEFTADCLVFPSGKTFISLRERTKTRAGITVVGRTFDDAPTSICVETALATLGIQGAACIQGFITSHGPVLTEANARFAGTFCLSEAAGANMLAKYMTYVLELREDTEPMSLRPLKMIRHWEATYISTGANK